MAARVFLILAAISLVGAFALAALAPPDMPLGQALYVADHDLLTTAEAGIQHHFAHWVWDDLAVPLLLRPVWLIPACIGLLCGGAAASFTSRPTPRTRRRS
jgi:hypothetical protein